MPVACNYPSFSYYDPYYSIYAKTYSTRVILPLIAFSTLQPVLFTLEASISINSKIINTNTDDTYEFLNYKRTLNCKGNLDSLDYNLSKFTILSKLASPGDDYITSSKAVIFTRQWFDLINNSYVKEQREAYLETIKLSDLGSDIPIDGFDFSIVDGKEYLLYLVIDIPFVGNTLDCSIEVHKFITDLVSYQKITDGVIYPYNPIGYNGPGEVYIPDTGDNELCIGET